MKASAALGALLWLTFVITLVFFGTLSHLFPLIIPFTRLTNLLVMAFLSHRRTTAGHTGPISDKPVADGPAPVEMQNQTQTQPPAYPQQTYQAPHMDSPYEQQQQQTYPAEHPQQAYHTGEQQPQAYSAGHQQAPYPVDPSQQAYAVPEHEHQQAYAVPASGGPHQQV